MLEVLKQIIIRLIFGNGKRNKKYQMKWTGEDEEKLTKGKEVYYIIYPMNMLAESSSILLYKIMRKLACIGTIMLLIFGAWSLYMGYEDGKSTILDASFLIILLWCITIISDLFYQYYEHTRWILTEEGILYSNIFGKVSLIPYKEIGEMVRKKKATIRKGCMYIPYKGGKIAIQLHSEMSEHEVIPVLNKQCDLELPEIHTFEEREVVRKGGMGTGLIKLGMIMFFIIFCLLQLYEINKNGEIKIYWDNNMWLLHGLLDLWIIAIGLVCRIVFYYPTWKFFRPYSCIKVR